MKLFQFIFFFSQERCGLGSDSGRFSFIWKIEKFSSSIIISLALRGNFVTKWLVLECNLELYNINISPLLRFDWKFLDQKTCDTAIKLHTAGSKWEKNQLISWEKTRTRAKSLDRELRWVHSLSSVYFHCGQHQSYCPFQWSMYKNQIPSEDTFFSNQLAASSIVAHRTKRKCSGFFFLWISVRSISLMNYAFLWNRKTLLWYKKQIKWNEW